MSRVSFAIITLFLLSAVLVSAQGPGEFTLIYQVPSSWGTGSGVKSYLHYNADNRGWNSIPGTLMPCPTNTSYSCSSYREVSVAGNSVVFVTTDGSGQWDNNGGRNYNAPHAGIYLLSNGNLQLLRKEQDGCPGTPSCSGHGVCDATSGTCTCDDHYYGYKCQKYCNCTGTHSSCDTSGNCICAAGWGNCSHTGCDTDLQTDVQNCGKCGNSCLGPNVNTAACVNETCSVTCDTGYTACPSGGCHKVCQLPGCQVYSDNECSGNHINTSTIFTNHTWQTPSKGETGWHASYQSYDSLKAYAQLIYTQDHGSVTVTIKTQTKDPKASIYCKFGAAGDWVLNGCTAQYHSPDTGPIALSVKTTTGDHLDLEPIDFLWDHPRISHTDGGDYRHGQKGSIVEFFGWPHEAIMKECEFLSKAGYLGAKFFPVQEQVMSSEPFNNVMNPWYFMYQPVSYRLQGRMGTREQLRAAINHCRKYNVRAYADAVVNHMSGAGNDANPFHRNPGAGCATWGAKNTSADFPPKKTGPLNGSSPYFTQGFVYRPAYHSHLSPMQEFPAVPWGPEDFHCERALNSWNDPLDLNAGWLTGLVDLNTERDYVRQRIADYFTDLLSIGFSGFRMDAAKHIQPPDLGVIFGKLKVNLGGKFPDDFVAWLEVLTGGEGNMLLCNPNSGYSYSKGLETELLKNNLTMAEVTKIKIWFDAYPKQPGIDCGQLEMNRKAIQNDDADQQNPGSTSRDMGNQGTVLVIEKDISLHRHFERKLFLDPNGASDNDNDYPIRMVLSSYWLPQDMQDYGVPDGLSNCKWCTEQCGTCDAAQSMNKTVAHEAGVPGYTGNMVGGHYTRVHRDNAIINAMRTWMHLPGINISSSKWGV